MTTDRIIGLMEVSSVMAARLAVILWLIPAVSLFAYGALQESGDFNSQVRKAIDLGNQQYIKAFKNGDAAGVAAVYDENGSRLAPKGVYFRGRNAIKADLEKFIKQVGPVTVTLETLDLWVIEDAAYETGKWSYTFKPSGGEQKTIGGRYVTAWRKQNDGGWKILADIGVD